MLILPCDRACALPTRISPFRVSVCQLRVCPHANAPPRPSAGVAAAGLDDAALTDHDAHTLLHKHHMHVASER
jgi:hypothetical protein